MHYPNDIREDSRAIASPMAREIKETGWSAITKSCLRRCRFCDLVFYRKMYFGKHCSLQSIHIEAFETFWLIDRRLFDLAHGRSRLNLDSRSSAILPWSASTPSTQVAWRCCAAYSTIHASCRRANYQPSPAKRSLLWVATKSRKPCIVSFDWNERCQVYMVHVFEASNISNMQAILPPGGKNALPV